MSNFAFLNTTEWHDIYRSATRAESYINSDPRTSLFHSRRTVELMVVWLYTNDPEFRQPYDDSLNALMADASFKRTVPDGVRSKMHKLRKLGNNAVHGKTKLHSAASFSVAKDLFHICHWFARTYTKGSPADVPDRFEVDQIPPSPKEVVRKTRQQLKALLAEGEQKDAENLKLLAENKKLKAELDQIRAEVALRRAANEQVPDHYNYDRTEAETRKLLIDVLLREAGWQVKKQSTDIDHFDTPTATIEVKLPSMTGRTSGYADYVLWGANGLPLAVVEAKRTSVDKDKGKQQAKLYADALEQTYGQRPIIFYTNGDTISLWDDKAYPPRSVQGFYTQDELLLLIQRRTMARPLDSVSINKKIVDRYYQEAAIQHVTEHFSEKHRHALLVMATGTGKTRTAVALVDLLMRANWVKRVLFLADRTALVKQAVRAFKTHLPASNPINLLEDKEARESRVVVSTYQTMMNQIDHAWRENDEVRLFSPGHFDLVIIDEAHRSVYQKFGAIFSYFDSLLLGLTATPKDEIDRNTYDLFKVEQGVPTYAYDLTTAVDDGYLVPPAPFSSDTKFLREGIVYDELSDEEKAEWDRLDWGDSEDIPDSVEAQALNQWLFNADTIDKVLETLMGNGLKVAGGDRLGKTIIFAKNQTHARMIVERFDVHYPKWTGHFCRRIDHSVKEAQTLIEAFSKRDGDPHIAVSVDMLDTGIDVPEVVNLVFFKPIRSKTKFYQMLGRGTRLCDDLFGPGENKTTFRVFDMCGNFEFFRLNPQGGPDNRQPKPLRQRLFEARLELLGAIQNSHVNASISAEWPPVAEKTADQLHAYVAAMNLKNFLVRPQRPYVEPFQQRARWNSVSASDLADLFQYVAPLPSEMPDDPEPAKRFDWLMLQLQLALVKGELKKRQPLQQKVMTTAALLNDKDSIPEVKARRAQLQQVQTDAFWEDVSVAQLEDKRESLRNLTRFIERKRQVVLTTDFEDTIGEVTPDYLPEVSSGFNKTQYRKKVETFIRENEDAVVIQKIRWAMPLSPTDLDQLDEMLFSAEEVESPTKFAQVYGPRPNLAAFIRGLVGLDRKVAKEKFATFLDNRRYNSDQIAFVNFIIEQLTANGTMQPQMLYDEPFSDLSPHGPEGLFSSEETDALIELINGINLSVEVR